MFPDFNIYSTPLLVLVLQGLLLSVLLFVKSYKNKNLSTLLLGILLLVTCYHRTTYTIGFMGWYDTYRSTKINYFLVSLTLAVGPLIYFYLESCVKGLKRFPTFKLLHFVPVLLYFLLWVGIYSYDANQAGFADTMNGVIANQLDHYFWTIISIVFSVHLLLYLALSFQLYNKYRASLVHHFSNTYLYELNWLRIFLWLFSFLFVYDVIQSFTDGFISDLHWTQEWWYQFFSILVVIYLGVKGYFMKVNELPELDELWKKSVAFTKQATTITKPVSYEKELLKLRSLMTDEQIFLDPSLSLSKLSRKLKTNPSLLSKMINDGAGQNFNDYVNTYRVEYVKTLLADKSQEHLSILAIGLDAGFNSKATFNRVFRKITDKSPSEYRK